jgi:hypothetical protein
MGFSISAPSSVGQLSQINTNTDQLESLLGTIQTQTNELEVPIANMDLNLTSIEALTNSLQALQTEIRDAVQTVDSTGVVTINENAVLLLDALNGALLLLSNIETNTDQAEALLTRLAGDSTVVADLSDPHFELTTVGITQLPSNLVNAAMLYGVKANGAVNDSPIAYGYNNTNLRFSLAPGGTVGIEAPQGKKVDTAEIWVQGSVGDGIAIALMN